MPGCAAWFTPNAISQQEQIREDNVRETQEENLMFQRSLYTLNLSPDMVRHRMGRRRLSYPFSDSYDEDVADGDKDDWCWAR